MPHTAADRVATALRYRNLAVDAFNEAQAQYDVAVLDHATARIVEAHPETTHLTFAHSPHDRRIELHGLWTTHRSGAEELVLDARRAADTTPLDLDELADDLSEALAGLHSAAWSAVRPTSRTDGRRVLDLPPADRAARIAELARAHRPKAALLTVEFVGGTCRVLEVTSANTAEAGRTLAEPTPATDAHPLWPQDTERRICALARQIHALPHLRAQHLVRVGGPTERKAIILLPQTETDTE